MRFFFFLFFVAFFSVGAVVAAPSRIVMDMAKDSVDVTTGFSGSEIVVFGNVETDGRDAGHRGVVVLLKGPDARIIVRKKEPVMGMWVNSDSIEFRNVPTFYDYAVSINERDLAPAQTLIENGIGLNTLVFDPEDRDDRDDNERFRLFQEALIRLWQRHGNLPLDAKKVRFLGNGLFRADFILPANIPTGAYQVEAFLFEGGKLVDKREKILQVQQAGTSAVIHHYAQSYSLMYALFGFAMAVGMGLLSYGLARKGR